MVSNTGEGEKATYVSMIELAIYLPSNIVILCVFYETIASKFKSYVYTHFSFLDT